MELPAEVPSVIAAESRVITKPMRWDGVMPDARLKFVTRIGPIGIPRSRIARLIDSGVSGNQSTTTIGTRVTAAVNRRAVWVKVIGQRATESAARPEVMPMTA